MDDTATNITQPMALPHARASCLWAGLLGLWVGPLLSLGAAQQPTRTDHTHSPTSSVIEALSTQPGERILDVKVNRSKVLTSPKPIKRVALTNAGVAGFVTLNKTQILIQGKKPGVTHLLLTDEDNRVTAMDVRVTADVSQLEDVLRHLFPGVKVSVYPVGDRVVLAGKVDRAELAAEINQAARVLCPNLLNRIEVVGVQQVLLKVQIGELQITRMRDLGVDWWYKTYNKDSTYARFIVSRNAGTGDIRIAHPNQMIVGGTAVDYPLATRDFRFVVQAPVAPTDAANLYFGLEKNRFMAFLRALQENSLYKLLAEPNLVAISGQPASFQVGGEQPYQVATRDGIAVEWKNFGTQLRFTASVIRGNRIRLRVEPESSELDFTRGVQVGSFVVPGLTTRRFKTEVELEAGQTLAIAGLMRRTSTTTNSGVPLLGDLPVIGALWRHVTSRREVLELLVLVTPELVAPLEPDQVPAPPGDELRQPNDLELYLFGLLSAPRDRRARGPRPRPVPRSPKDLPMFMGPTGPETR